MLKRERDKGRKPCHVKGAFIDRVNRRSFLFVPEARKLECIAPYTTPRALIASRYAALDIRPRDRNLLRHNQRNTLSPPLAGFFSRV